MHGDAVRNFTGGYGHGNVSTQSTYETGTGIIVANNSAYGGNGTATGGGMKWITGFSINAGRVLPVGNKNAPRAFGVLPCVYLGRIVL